ncbi:MAG: hypothetical protein COA69_13610 [Robiginitomaculum sp.]|nr:MAG: hypothetical protein COA69_13610 [Robiginitomaculum sp.]
MPNNIINKDFGKTDRESARKLRELLGIIEAFEADMIANPVKYFNLARQEIESLQRKLLALKVAAWPRFDEQFIEPDAACEPEPIKTVRIQQEDYNCLQALRKQLNDK